MRTALRSCRHFRLSADSPNRCGHGGGVCTARLVITQNILRSPGSVLADYATLSYCWGDPAIAATRFVTNSSNLTDRCRGFPVSSLSQVVQDAVATSRALSIRYLWVDALCILQGMADIQD